ncbi:hypothetical protein AMECASPLE_022971 [Ameca splendens]|uniref:Uncharacterized protein n=1 Tax=Ameca splendens TaxID=208324 RepID=A0ABV0XSW4_9TELE
MEQCCTSPGVISQPSLPQDPRATSKSLQASLASVGFYDSILRKRIGRNDIHMRVLRVKSNMRVAVFWSGSAIGSGRPSIIDGTMTSALYQKNHLGNAAGQ